MGTLHISCARGPSFRLLTLSYPMGAVLQQGQRTAGPVGAAGMGPGSQHFPRDGAAGLEDQPPEAPPPPQQGRHLWASALQSLLRLIQTQDDKHLHFLLILLVFTFVH